MTEQRHKYEFQGELFQGPRGGYYINFPFDTGKEFGTRKQIKVKVWFDGHPERKSLLPKGDGTHWISVAYNIRMALAKTDGDLVSVIIEKDDDPRIVLLPEELEWLLDNEPELKTFFQKQSYYTQKFFCEWIIQVKDPDMQVKRINRIFEWLQRHHRGKTVAPFKDESMFNDGMEE
jgi:hypothetical protein